MRKYAMNIFKLLKRTIHPTLNSRGGEVKEGSFLGILRTSLGKFFNGHDLWFYGEE